MGQRHDARTARSGVFLSYASAKGHAFIDRALYFPEEWTQDRVRCREAGVPLSAGEGSQGPRLYEWAWLRLPYEREGDEGWASWLLMRRNLSDHSKRAYYRAWGPASTPLTVLVRVAGSRLPRRRGL